MGNSLSDASEVKSGVVQGSVLGPTLFVMLTNSLLYAVKLPIGLGLGAFADDLKFAVDVAIYTRPEVQEVINTIADWAGEHHMPLSVQKSVVMHCGNNQPNHTYTLNGQPMAQVNSIRDLGVIRCANHSLSEQCHAAASKATRAAFGVRRALGNGARELLWPAFQYYVLPILMYCSPAWSPRLRSDIQVIERVQRRYTKIIPGLRELSYSEQLRVLHALPLQDKRICADMTIVYRCLHGLVKCPLSSLGLSVAATNTRSNLVNLQQRRLVSKTHGALFCCRAPSQWNKLPAKVTQCHTISNFKENLFNYLIKQNCN